MSRAHFVFRDQRDKSDDRDKSDVAGNADNDNAELTTPILVIAFVSGVSLVTKALPFQEETKETK